MKVYITRSALQYGEIEVREDAHVTSYCATNIVVPYLDDEGEEDAETFVHGEWFLTEEEAQQRVHEMAKARREVLRKEIQKLDGIIWEGAKVVPGEGQ